MDRDLRKRQRSNGKIMTLEEQAKNWEVIRELEEEEELLKQTALNRKRKTSVKVHSQG